MCQLGMKKSKTRLDTIPSQSEVEPSDDDVDDIMRFLTILIIWVPLLIIISSVRSSSGYHGLIEIRSAAATHFFKFFKFFRF